MSVGALHPQETASPVKRLSLSFAEVCVVQEKVADCFFFLFQDEEGC